MPIKFARLDSAGRTVATVGVFVSSLLLYALAIEDFIRVESEELGCDFGCLTLGDELSLGGSLEKVLRSGRGGNPRSPLELGLRLVDERDDSALLPTMSEEAVGLGDDASG